jgi:hypothetical protein
MPYPSFPALVLKLRPHEGLILRAFVTHVAEVSFYDFITKNPIVYICFYVILNFEMPCEMCQSER